MSYHSNCESCGVHISSSSPITVNLCEKCLSEAMNKLREGTEDVEVNEYGEIVSKRNNRGVKIKPHTFFT